MNRLLKLVPDVPVEIALSCSEGINVVSPRGTPAVKYTLVDGRTFFATAYVAAKFKRLNIQPHQRIALCMRNIDGKSITIVERVSPGEGAIDPPQSGNESLGGEPGPIDEVVVPNGHHPPPTSDPDPSVPDSPTNGDSGATESASKGIGMGDCPSQLERALKTAILATQSAEQYAKEIGYAVRFDQESIKCMAVTVLIGMQGGRY